MEKQFCCEEMKELVKSILPEGNKKNVKVGKENCYTFWIENGKIDEMGIYGKSNIVFRFCPYCGSPLKEGEIKKTKNGTFNKVVDLVFKKELDEPMGVQAHEALLDDTIAELRKLLKASVELVDNKS